MFPWGADFSKREAKSLFKTYLDKEKISLPELERRMNALMAPTEEALARTTVTRSLIEATAPEGALELNRVWRSLDAAIGPGKSVAHILLARYQSLRLATQRMDMMLRNGLRARLPANRRLFVEEMKKEIAAFAKLKTGLADATAKNCEAIGKKLQAKMVGSADKKLEAASNIRKECQTALDDMQASFERMRAGLEKVVDSRPKIADMRAKAKAFTAKLAKSTDSGVRAVMAYRLKSVLRLADGQKAAAGAAHQIKNELRQVMPLIDDIEDDSLFFMEALGVIAGVSDRKARILRKYVEQGKTSLNSWEMQKIPGYLGNLRGLLPEEVAMRMKFFESVFHKNAFEALSAFPPALRSKMKVEMVEGPLWAIDHKGAARQFGDGCMLLTDDKGRSAIVGLAELKAGFDDELLRQLFERSDRRVIDSVVTFLDAKGKPQVRRLTRDFAVGEKQAAVGVTPIYVYGRPSGETHETAEMFKKMVDEDMKNGREVWKVPLPISVQQNEQFADVALAASVKAMIKQDSKWGLR